MKVLASIGITALLLSTHSWGAPKASVAIQNAKCDPAMNVNYTVDCAPVDSLALRLAYCLEFKRGLVMDETRLVDAQYANCKLHVGDYLVWKKQAASLMNVVSPQVRQEFLSNVQMESMKQAVFALATAHAADVTWDRKNLKQGLKKIVDEVCTRTKTSPGLDINAKGLDNSCSPKQYNELNTYLQTAAPSAIKAIPAVTDEAAVDYFKKQFASMNALLNSTRIPFKPCFDYSVARGNVVKEYACPPDGFPVDQWDFKNQVPLTLQDKPADPKNHILAETNIEKRKAYETIYRTMISSSLGVLALTPQMLGKAGDVPIPSESGIIGVGHPDQIGGKTSIGITSLQFRLHGDDFSVDDIRTARQQYTDAILYHAREENDNVWQGFHRALNNPNSAESNVKQALLLDGMASGRVASANPSAYVQVLCKALSDMIDDKKFQDKLTSLGIPIASLLVSIIAEMAAAEPEADAAVAGAAVVGGDGIITALMTPGSLATRLSAGIKAGANLTAKGVKFTKSLFTKEGAKTAAGAVAKSSGTFGKGLMLGTWQLVLTGARTSAAYLWSKQVIETGIQLADLPIEKRKAELRKTQYFLSMSPNDQDALIKAIDNEKKVSAELPGNVLEAASSFLLPAKYGGLGQFKF